MLVNPNYLKECLNGFAFSSCIYWLRILYIVIWDKYKSIDVFLSKDFDYLNLTMRYDNHRDDFHVACVQKINFRTYKWKDDFINSSDINRYC